MLCKPQIMFIHERILSILGIEPPPVFYIGGSDTLPPPLEKDAEEAAIAALCQGDEAARQLLIEGKEDRYRLIAISPEAAGPGFEGIV